MNFFYVIESESLKWHIYGQLNCYSHEKCPVGADRTSSNISWVSLRPNVYSIYESIV
jgi:hypothetical protein